MRRPAVQFASQRSRAPSQAQVASPGAMHDAHLVNAIAKAQREGDRQRLGVLLAEHAKRNAR